MPDYNGVGERSRSVETAFSMTRGDKTQSGHTGLRRLLWNACQSSTVLVLQHVDVSATCQHCHTSLLQLQHSLLLSLHHPENIPNTTHQHSFPSPPTSALLLLKLLCHGEASSGHQCYGTYWAHPWKNIFYLPINMSSSRSISRASAACWSQELCCFARLLKNSAFSICLAKFIRSCNKITFRHYDQI